jgi:hypothetical protein
VISHRRPRLVRNCARGAGTHTPRPRVLAQWLTASATTDDGGDGSLLSQGRRIGMLSSTNGRHTPRHRVSPSASPMTGSSGVSSTPRLLGSITDVCGILDRPVKPGDDDRKCGAFAFKANLRLLAARGARGFAKTVRASINRGRRESRVANAPAASRAKQKSTERSHHRFTGNSPAFPAQWFYGLLRALPGDHALLTPSPARLLADLTPALGRQNNTTWPYASASFVRLAVARLTPPRPPHPAPRS